MRPRLRYAWLPARRHTAPPAYQVDVRSVRRQEQSIRPWLRRPAGHQRPHCRARREPSRQMKRGRLLDRVITCLWCPRDSGGVSAGTTDGGPSVCGHELPARSCPSGSCTQVMGMTAQTAPRNGQTVVVAVDDPSTTCQGCRLKALSPQPMSTHSWNPSPLHCADARHRCNEALSVMTNGHRS